MEPHQILPHGLNHRYTHIGPAPPRISRISDLDLIPHPADTGSDRTSTSESESRDRPERRDPDREGSRMTRSGPSFGFHRLHRTRLMAFLYLLYMTCQATTYTGWISDRAPPCHTTHLCVRVRWPRRPCSPCSRAERGADGGESPACGCGLRPQTRSIILLVNGLPHGHSG